MVCWCMCVCHRYRHEIAHDGQRIYILGGGTSWTSYPLDKVLHHVGYTHQAHLTHHQNLVPEFQIQNVLNVC